MRTTFSGIQMASRALRAQQRSLDVVGHNVANANTPGYARQRAVHTASRPYTIPSLVTNPSNGQFGTGVEVAAITRMRDHFVETRLRQENHNLGYWEEMKQGLEQVELIFNEPSENNVHQALDMYWDSLQELSKSPENEATRAVVLQRAEVLAETIRHSRSQLGRLRDNVNDLVQVKASEINSLAERIAALNDQIGKVTASGNNPNDLLDKRDVLLEELSTITNIEVSFEESGMALVSISGATLVSRSHHFTVETKLSEDTRNYGRVDMVWQASGRAVEAERGQLRAILDLRDHELEGFLEDLNVWTADLVNTVNSIHRQGYNLDDEHRVNFFQTESMDPQSGLVTPAGDPSLSLRVALSDPRSIAASALVDDQGRVIEGNGAIALTLATLRHRPASAVLSEIAPDTVARLHMDATITLGDRFNAMISGLGVKALKANTMTDNSQVLSSHLQNLRESVSGVSLDEEMADMIRFQHAYSAAARMMTAMDEALDVVINRMGLVGR